jgi:hypothetical protein
MRIQTGRSRIRSTSSQLPRRLLDIDIAQQKMAHHVVDPVNLLQVHAVAFDAPDHCPYLAVLPGKREHETRAGGEALASVPP